MNNFLHRTDKGDIGKRIFALLLLLVFSVAAAGCWDMRELQDRSFVSAIAIDLADEGKAGTTQAGAQVESFTQGSGENKYRLSLQIVKLTPSNSEDGPGGAPSRTFVISTTGQSMLEMIRDMLGQSSKGLYFEHLDAIILSEKSVRLNGLLPVLDLWLRDPEMRRRIKVFITPGEARKIIEFSPPSGEAGGRFLVGVINNHKKNMHVGGSRTDLGFISQALDNDTDIIIPRIELEDKIIKVGGLAMFRKDQFAGYIDEYTMAGLKFISGTPKSAAIAVPCPEHPWSSLVFEMFIHETTLRPYVDNNGNIYFTLDISMWGSLAEAMCSNKHNLKDPQFLRRMEKLVAEAVTQNCLHTLQVAQQNRVDLARLGTKMKAYQPKAWKLVKDRWGEIYPHVPMQISVNVVIRNLGEHN